MPTNTLRNTSFALPPPLPAVAGGRDAFCERVPGARGTRLFWYALRTRSRTEFKVSESLQGAGFEVFLPTYSETARWSDRVKTTVRPLFAGYVFSRFERFSEASAILGTTGVIAILGHNEIDSISDDEVANLRLIAALPASPCPHVAQGDAVTITSGPLTGVSGVVVRTKGAYRLVVSVEMLGRSASVEIAAADVKAEKKAA